MDWVVEFKAKFLNLDWSRYLNCNVPMSKYCHHTFSYHLLNRLYYFLLYGYIWLYKPKSLSLSMFFSGRASTLSVATCGKCIIQSSTLLFLKFPLSLFVTLTAVPSCGPDSPLSSASPPVPNCMFFRKCSEFLFHFSCSHLQYELFLNQMYFYHISQIILPKKAKNSPCLNTYTNTYGCLKVWITDTCEFLIEDILFSSMMNKHGMVAKYFWWKILFEFISKYFVFLCSIKCPLDLCQKPTAAALWLLVGLGSSRYSHCLLGQFRSLSNLPSMYSRHVIS